jgi:outer membrane protein
MKKFSYLVLACCCLSLSAAPLCAANAPELKLGVVNAKVCIEKSKKGQQEKNSFEALKKQMSDSLEKSDKELADLAKKLEDKDYLDSLSPAAEEEMKGRFESLSQEFVRYQNQYYQLLNQANYRMLQNLHDAISSASESVRSAKNLSLVTNKDSIFASAPTLDVTTEVIAEMDKRFELEGASTKDQVTSVEGKK